ncbi:hypothetical protein K788_0008135 [Paraburkholderia caribensis MBA4]|uniref:Uncharacterized protein n=1 Tax=Paraburkholderia caribensis MBA4 TaxID=1323664 RepID=A0A0P0RG70_9BURK|nr:hypothetical protein K788_0008135 [Paraburkholderia caribensis MBA4]
MATRRVLRVQLSHCHVAAACFEGCSKVFESQGTHATRPTTRTKAAHAAGRSRTQCAQDP